MNDLQIFENPEFGSIRTVMINNEPWFVGKDVAEVLGYTNPSKALIDHVDDEDKQALELHYKIINSADITQSALWDMCKNLKEMRDSKLYKALGYKNFEDYCENEVGMKRSNAYNYISIVERVKIENVQSMENKSVF